MASALSDRQAPGDLVELGRVAGAYGVQGWLHIHSHSADSNTLLGVKDWWIKAPASKMGVGASSRPSLAYSPVRVRSCRVHGAQLVAKLDGVDDRTLAEQLKGNTVWVSRAAFPKLQHDEYYWVDLVGCLLYGEADRQQVLIGQVASVTDNGAHAILHVNRASIDDTGALVFDHDTKGRLSQTLVPFVAAHVHTVDLGRQCLYSNWPLD